MREVNKKANKSKIGTGKLIAAQPPGDTQTKRKITRGGNKKKVEDRITLLEPATDILISSINTSTARTGKTREYESKKLESKRYEVGSVLMPSAIRSESRMTAIEKMQATIEGITKKELEELKQKADLDYYQLSFILDVSRASLIAKKGAEKFSASLSEKIMSLADIYSYGYEVFGGVDEFNKWIFQPVAAFGSKAPYEILNNQYGREEVKNVIGRIDFGVYS